MQTTTQRCQLRDPIQADLQRLLAIDAACFPQCPWTEEAYRGMMRSLEHVGTVAVHGQRVVGFAWHRVHGGAIECLSLAVEPESRRRGVGRALLERMQARTSATRRYVFADVYEEWLESQLFLKACGYRATHILTGVCDDGCQCGACDRPPTFYRMEWRR